MTQLEGQPQQQSAFNQRADNAALALKDQLGQELSAQTGQQVVLPPSPVPVGQDGQPVGQLPPEGSYARTALEQQQQQAQPPQQQQPAPTPATPPAPAPQQQEPISQRAQERITSLVSQLRTKDQEFQQLQQQQVQQATSVEELQSQLTAQQNQMQNLLEQNLESLDPEARAQVMQSAQLSQAVAASEQRILQRITPKVQALENRNLQLEKSGLSGTYRGYDPMVHDALIDEFRRGNPNCSVEQAFRACATAEELSVGAGRPAPAPPPAIPPGNGAPSPRYMPQAQANQPDPIQQIKDDAARAAELARSSDPADQKAATALWNKNLADRLFGPQ
jgi:hypothetical protein